jgi:hypothetical protein
MEVLTPAGVTADPVLTQCRPVDRAGQTFQFFFRETAENTGFGAFGLKQGLSEVQFHLSRTVSDFARRGPPSFQFLVNPRNEKQVSEPCLDRARTGKEMVRKRIPDATEPEFIARFALLEEREHPLRALAFCGIEVEPGKGWLHIANLTPYFLSSPGVLWNETRCLRARILLSKQNLLRPMPSNVAELTIAGALLGLEARA